MDAGAADINQDVGSAAATVRQFTAAQYETRFGEAPQQNLIQSVSDEIAQKVLGGILQTGTVPSIDQIAQDDALPTATGIFRGDPGRIGELGRLGGEMLLRDVHLEGPPLDLGTSSAKNKSCRGGTGRPSREGNNRPPYLPDLRCCSQSRISRARPQATRHDVVWGLVWSSTQCVDDGNQHLPSTSISCSNLS
jgi:hypothetical protein